MAGHDIVAIGASAGGVEALTQLVRQLTPDFPAAIFVVLHVAPDSVSLLPSILRRAGPLAAGHARNGDAIQSGRIYIAPPDRHLLLNHQVVRVVEGPRENRHRPAIDPLFRTAARAYGSRVVGVLLSGAGDDGVAGLRAIKGRGGLAVVQNPADALYPDLAQHALDAVDVDRIAPVAEMGRVLAALAREPAPPTPAPGAALEKEARIAELDLDVVEDDDKVGRPSAYSCPDCGGVLWEIEHDDFLRFRCRVGHAFTSRALAEEQGDAVERALWAAFRTLEESEAFARRLAVRARRAGHQWLAERYLRRAEETSVDAAAIRRMIVEIGEQHETAVTAKAIADPYRPTEAGR